MDIPQGYVVTYKQLKTSTHGHWFDTKTSWDSEPYILDQHHITVRQEMQGKG